MSQTNMRVVKGSFRLLTPLPFLHNFLPNYFCLYAEILLKLTFFNYLLEGKNKKFSFMLQ